MIIRKKGQRYYVSVEVGRDPATGRRREKGIGSYPTKKEAVAAGKLADTQQNASTFVEPGKQTLGEVLKDWLVSVQQAEDPIRHSTWDSYRSNLETHVIPRLGDVKITKLTSKHLKDLYSELGTNGRRDGKGGLSPRTVQLIHTTIRKALNDSVEDGLIPRNVALGIRRKKKSKQSARPKPKVWAGGSLRTFLDGVADDRLSGCYQLAAMTGMRRGEILGLRWEDVDLDGGGLTVAQTYITVGYKAFFSKPKTDESCRTIALDELTVKALREHKSRQNEERLAAGPGYVDSGLVFTKESGVPIHPQSLSDAFKKQVKRSGLPRIRFHDLRHTHATLALEAGVHPKVVSDRLGHANITITLDTYSHVAPRIQAEAAESIAAAVRGMA